MRSRGLGGAALYAAAAIQVFAGGLLGRCAGDNPLCRNQECACRRRQLMGKRLYPVLPVLRDEGLHPRVVVAVEDRFLSTLHDQAIELHKLRVADVAGWFCATIRCFSSSSHNRRLHRFIDIDKST